MSTMRRFISLLLFTVAACSSSSANDTPATTPPAADPPPLPPPPPPVDAGQPRTPPPPYPQIPNNGGPVIASPEIVTITWDADPIAADIEAFDDWMVPSSFWKTMMAEWGVGPGTHPKSWRIATPPPAVLDDADLRKMLNDAFAAGTIPSPNGSRIYTVYPPDGTTVTSFGSEGCKTFQAYHSSFATSSGLAVYAIAPRCDGGKTYGMTPIDFVTWGQSHEIMEASSDPDASHPTWLILQQTPETPELGENADLCTGNPMRVEGHMVTRNWSNVAAAKGDPPCVPAPANAVFGAFPEKNEISLAPGASATMKVHLYTSGTPFKVTAYPAVPDLTVKQDKSSGADGDVITLTITASKSYAEIEGQNIILLFSSSQDYSTRRAIIVHAK